MSVLEKGGFRLMELSFFLGLVVFSGKGGCVGGKMGAGVCVGAWKGGRWLGRDSGTLLMGVVGFGRAGGCLGLGKA